MGWADDWGYVDNDPVVRVWEEDTRILQVFEYFRLNLRLILHNLLAKKKTPFSTTKSGSCSGIDARFITATNPPQCQPPPTNCFP